MLSKIPFHHITDIGHHWKSLQHKRPQFIAPDPQRADCLRTLLQPTLSLTPNVITMARFIHQQWQQFPPPQPLHPCPELCPKPKLITILGAAWKKFFPQKPHSQFVRALQLFTELRSFSLDHQVVSSVLEDFEPSLQAAVARFWQLCDQLNLHDEQRVTNELAQRWRSPRTSRQNLPDHQHFTFWGFEFFSNIQIALLDSLSLLAPVEVWIPATMLQQANSLDWPSWLPGKDSPPPLPRRPLLPVKIIRYPKNHLNQTVAGCRERFFAPQLLPSQGHDIVVAKRELEFSDILEFPSRNLQFKSPVELLKIPLLKALHELQALIGQPTQLVLEHCQRRLEQMVEKQHFTAIKNWLLLKNFLHQWQTSSQENTTFALFDWELTQQLLPLSHPRTFSLPLLPAPAQGKVLSLREWDYDPTTPTLIVGQGRYPSLKHHHLNYSPPTLERLAAIGPIKRGELEFAFTQQFLADLLSHPQTYLLLENGLETQDLAWSELLEPYQLTPLPLSLAKKPATPLVWEKKSPTPSLGKLSPSKLQTYLDCPQKYYYQYVERKHLYPHLTQTLLGNEKGLVEHSIIENYLQQSTAFDPTLFEQVCHKQLTQFCQQAQKDLPPSTQLLITEELRVYAQNGIEFLLQFICQLEQPTLALEVSIDPRGNSPFSGKVDCVIHSLSGDFIFDFKRSGSSIPSKKEVEEYQNIQLCYYAHHLPGNHNWKGLGYINLSDPDNSLLWLEDTIPQPRGKVYQTNQLNSLIAGYGAQEQRYCQELSAQTQFAPQPRTPSVCRFCPLELICPREAP